MPPPPSYKSSDIYFSAYLRVAGVPLVGTEWQGPRMWFLFDTPTGPGAIRALKADYYSGNGQVPALEYARSLRDLKAMVTR